MFHLWRHQHRTLVSLLVLVTLVAMTRYHIRDLGQTAWTYATFGSLNLNKHLFFPGNAQGLQPKPNHLSPRILHQIFLDEGRNSTLDRYTTALNSCGKLHSEWEYRFWTDDEATQFVRESYPDILPHYRAYRQTISRTNILRYLLLHHYGGVYLDLDITCHEPLDQLLHLPWLTPAAYPAGINNAFILSKPNHPFLSELISQIPSHDLAWPMPYVQNMLTTGCMFISNAWMGYMRHDAEHQPKDRLYILADQLGNLDSHMLRGQVVTPLFGHGGASSWHGWDAALIIFTGRHYLLALFAVLGTVIMVVCPTLCLLYRHHWRRRRLGFNGEDILSVKLG